MTPTTRTAALGVFAAVIWSGVAEAQRTGSAWTTDRSYHSHSYSLHHSHTEEFAAASHSHGSQDHSHPLPHHGHSYAATGHTHAATEHTHPASAHSHNYAARYHTHSDLKHAHPFAATDHTHDGVPDHTHTYAAVDHTHVTPATPAPGSQSCTYEHRIIGVPSTTGAGFTSQILIGSKDATATVKISAFQADNGQAIDVLDSEGAAVGTSTPLAPANSVKLFRLEGISGWHTVIVEHPTKAAMNNATVAMRLREPDSGVSIEHVPGIEHCAPTSTRTGPPAPDLAIRYPQALLWPKTFDWRASVVNIGDAPAAPTTVQVYLAARPLDEGKSGARELDTKAIDVEIAAGAEWRMSDYIPRRRDSPSIGDVVRICVYPVPGESRADLANNCASATVERN